MPDKSVETSFRGNRKKVTIKSDISFNFVAPSVEELEDPSKKG